MGLDPGQDAESHDTMMPSSRNHGSLCKDAVFNVRRMLRMFTPKVKKVKVKVTQAWPWGRKKTQKILCMF